MKLQFLKRALFFKFVSALVAFSFLISYKPLAGYTFNSFDSNELRPSSQTVNSPVVIGIRNDLAGSPIQNKTDFVYEEDPQKRIGQVVDLLRGIEAEITNPWTSKLPDTFVFSDFHGDVKRFIQLLSYKLYQLLGFRGELKANVSIEKQLNDQKLSLKDINGNIVFGGDYIDRGPFGLKCFFIADEIVKVAPDRNVSLMGNHDMWAEGNISGYHLPVRKNFNFYGDSEAEKIIKQQRKEHPEYFDSKEGLLWWAGQLARYNESQDKFQKEFTFEDGKKAEEVRKDFLKLYEKYALNWDEEQLRAMRNFIGHFPHLDVPDPYLGLNGIGKTSRWWQDALCLSLDRAYEIRNSAGAKDDELEVWINARVYAGQMKKKVNDRLTQALSEGQWWYRIFEAINTQAYKSAEWWFSNWSSRKDWGGAVLKELNDMLKDSKVNHVLIRFDRTVFKGEEVTQANYHKSKTLEAFAEFIRKNANFYFRNPYGVTISHSYIPVENNGQIVINYKGETYSDENMYKGLKTISADYAKFTGSFDESIGEARELVNSWYADETTKIKPRDELRYREDLGVAAIQSRIKTHYWFTGHNPTNKLKAPFIVRDKKDPGYAHGHIDYFMAEKYGGSGASINIGANGIQMYGFKDAKSNSIIASPPTVIPGKDGKPATTIDNTGVSRDEFLTNIKRTLKDELLNLVDQIEPIQEGCDILARIAAFIPKEFKQQVYEKIAAKAKTKGVWLDSPHKLYEAIRERYLKGTVPAINIRGLTYDVARSIFRSAKKNRVGMFIFEIARSEIGYTDQRPAEYSAVILSAALAEGYKGPVFIQLDHCQINAKKFAENKDKEIKTVKELIQEAIKAGFYSIDIDTSTLVDLEKPNLTEQQRLNFEWAAELTDLIRTLQPKGITVAVGGEIGEVGKKNSTVEELEAFMEGYNKALVEKGEGLKGISKISVQTGTTHGGVPLPDGTIAKVKLDFDTLEKLSKIAREKYGLAGAVQHGASTLPPDAFNRFPEVTTAEVHLATEFQNMIYDNKLFPADFKAEIYAFLQNHPDIKKEKKPDETDEQFLYKVRKNGFGPFKQRFWDLPKAVRVQIGEELEKKFDFLFTKLSVVDTDVPVTKEYPLNVSSALFDNTAHPHFVDTKAVVDALKEVVDFDASGKVVRVINEEKLRGEVIDNLSYDAVFNTNPEVLNLSRRVIRETAKVMGIVPKSVYGLYSQKSKDPRKYTIPAVNMRGLGYDTATALYTVAKQLGISDIIPEIAKSEIGYTGQRPEEYVIVNLAGAIKAGYNAPVFIQGDHFQIDRSVYMGDTEKKQAANPQKAIDDIEKLIRESLLAGFGQIDLDMSTMVDWAKESTKDYDGMQQLNYIATAYFTLYVRYLEKDQGLEIINLGGEIGEVGKGIQGRDSTVEDYGAFMAGYKRCLNMFIKGQGYETLPIPDFLKERIKKMREELFISKADTSHRLIGISKIAIQAGTAHGLGGKANFKALAEIGQQARKDGLAGVVFHGASKTDIRYFPLYAGNYVEGAIEVGVVYKGESGKVDIEIANNIVKILNDNPVAEVHLATEFQDIILDTIKAREPAAYLGIEAFIKSNLQKANKWPEKEVEQQQALKDKDNRKNIFGPLKAALHNLPAQEKVMIRRSLEKRFTDFFSSLGVGGINDTWSQKLGKDVLAEFNSKNEFGDFITGTQKALKGAKIGAVLVSAKVIFENAAAVETLKQMKALNKIVVWAEDEVGLKKLTALDVDKVADVIVQGLEKALQEIKRFNISNEKVTVIKSQNDLNLEKIFTTQSGIKVINMDTPKNQKINVMPLVIAKAATQIAQNEAIAKGYEVLEATYAKKYNIPKESLQQLTELTTQMTAMAPQVEVSKIAAESERAYWETVDQV